MMDSKQSCSINRKRVVLSVPKKLELIKKLESGVSVACICDEYGIKKQTVSDIRKSKEKLQAYAVKYNIDSSQPGSSMDSRKHMKMARNKNLEEAVYKWYMQECIAGVNVRGVELRSAANAIAKRLNIENFRASDGWLWRFRNRHGLGVKKNLHCQDENAGTDLFQSKLNDLIKNEEKLLPEMRLLPHTVLSSTRNDNTNHPNQSLSSFEENSITERDVETLLEECESEASYQVFTSEKNMKDINRANGDRPEEREALLKGNEISNVCDWIDNLLNYVEKSRDDEIQPYYVQLFNFKEIVLRKQHESMTQIELNSPNGHTISLSKQLADQAVHAQKSSDLE